MFGYVKTYTPELKVREYEFYKSVYCGLCRSMGKCTGCLSRFSLNYDIVFLALIRLAINGDEYKTEKKRCFAHPLTKRIIMRQNESLSYCARISALLTASKVRDDATDKKGFSRIPALIAAPAVNSAARRADMPKLNSMIKDGMAALSEEERKKTASVDIPARIFGEILGEIFAFGIGDCDGSAQKRIAREIGLHTGRWIYALDAADDIERDARDENYNPFLLLYGGADLDEGRRADILNALRFELSSIERAINLIDFGACPGILNIIRNIIYLGMPATAERVITKGKNADDE